VSQSDVLAIFTPQAPVEQVVAPVKQDVGGGDDRFQRYLDDASHKVEPTTENHKPATDRQDHASTQSQSEKKPIEKPRPTESKETDQITPKETLNQAQPTKKDSENISPQELTSIDNFKEAVDHLKELGFDSETIQTLLEIFENDSGVDVATLLQSLIAKNSKLNDFSIKDFLAANSLNESSLSQLQNRQNLISDLLKKAGLSNQEAKNLIQEIQSKITNESNSKDRLSEQVRTTSAKDINQQLGAISQAAKDIFNENNSKQKNGENDQSKKDLMVHNSKAQNLEPVDRDSDIEKLLKQIGNQHKNKNSSEATEKVTSKQAGLKNITIQTGIGMKYASANLDAATSKNLDAIKVNGDVQVQTMNAAGENNQKTASAAKASLPENPIYKAPIETRVIDQIINRISVRSNSSQSEVKIKLDPPSLGRVRMNIITSGDGVRTVIVAENQAVKQVIESNLSQLRDSMASQGLKIDSFSVLVGGDGSAEFSQHGEHSDQSDEEFSDFVNHDESLAEPNEEMTIPASFKFYDISQTVSVIA